MKPIRRKDFLFLLFPKLRLLKFSFDSLKCIYHCYTKKKTKKEMRLPVKIAIGCAIGLVVIIVFGFIAFPKMIKGKVKSMINLNQGSEIRQMFVKVPFALDFKIYMFNVTNPMDVQKGALPVLKEVGPFCFEEWKEKVDLDDNDDEDVMFYNPKDTFYKANWPGCLDGSQMITMAHPLILGMVNTVVRTKPGAISLISKAINSIYNNPDSIFMTAPAIDILFDGVIIKCGVKDFAGKAVCSQLKEAPDLRHVNDDDLAFSFIGPKNATPGKRFKVFRGVKESHDVGRILEYDSKNEMEVWPTKECNQYKGTDGTVFPPYLTKEEGLASFAPDLCRSLVAVYSGDTKYDGIPVRIYTATLGDMSKNADEKCYCPTPDTCLKKGIMDLFKCAGVPVYVSLPHFYESDESYVKGVVGLNPNKEDHGIQILFEATTGGPVKAAKRLQFNMPLEPNPKLPIFANLPNTVLPLFWVEEGVALNNTFTKPLKDLFKIMKIVKIAKWVILVGCLGGLGAAGYLYFSKKGEANITPVHKVKPAENGVSTIGGEVNHAMSDNDLEKY
ncbi:sensory neuron membrane protein 1 [Tribolium madens]|uniref:sensory neuron membrane protein 1 n=1 Tax=Tribolium madens TaxID=41895 RepID=UPI001CF75381|nr:sensory neuron membrane protein 1 [Tribolium madens]